METKSKSGIEMEVRPILKSTANAVVSNKHYSRTLGIFWEGFGLYKNNELIGVCCFGQPSAAIQKHAFVDRDFRLYELTRLVVDRGHKNAASFLISQSLKKLKNVSKCAVISYADSAHGHSGKVYQASNWLYTGATVSHDHLYMVDGEKMHPMTLRDKLGITSPSKWAKENNIQKIKPSPKHRYFYILGGKKDKKEILTKLRYPFNIAYPYQEETSYYEDGSFPCEYYLTNK